MRRSGRVKSLKILLGLTLALVVARIGFSGPVRPLIRFVTLDIGAGHLMIGQSIQKSFEESELGQSEAVIDPKPVVLNDYMTPWEKLVWNDSYVWMAKHAPLLWEAAYSAFPWLTTQQMRRSNFSGLLRPPLVSDLTRGQPDLFFTTQSMEAVMLDILKERGLLPIDTKIVSFITDYSVTPAFLAPGLIIVPAQHLKDQLVKWGKDPSLVAVVNGIPARKQFLEPFNQAEVRARLNAKLSEELKTPDVLGTTEPLFVAMGGKEGIGIDQVIEFLPRWHPDRNVKIVLICGEDKEGKLRKRAEEAIRAGLDPKVGVIVRGFEKEIDLYAKAATVLITKPGGSTTAEALALRRAILSHVSVQGQEARNKKYLSGLGVIGELNLEDLNHLDEILRRIARIEAAIREKFPRIRYVANDIEEIVRSYLNGKIPESQSERAILKRRIEKRNTPETVQGCVGLFGF